MKFSATTLAMVAVTTTTLLLSCVVAQTPEYTTFTCVLEADNCIISGTETVCNSSPSAVPIACGNLEQDCDSCNIDANAGNNMVDLLDALNTWCDGKGGQLKQDPETGLEACSSPP